MYISSLSFKGYKNSKETSQIYLNKGLNVLLGENGSGKTAVINSLRLALREAESFAAFSTDDLYCSLDKNEQANEINIDVKFSELSEDEKVIFFTWCDAEFNAELHLDIIENKFRPATYRRKFWGGRMQSGFFEEDTFDKIECIYLPPLRDAEVKLSNGRRSRLAYLLKRRFDRDEDRSLVEKVQAFNDELTQNNGKIKETKTKINKQITDAIGSEMGQSINLQFSETTFSKIIENIRMVFFPKSGASDTDKFRDLATNSLGYNNLIYIATVFSELELLRNSDCYTAILIEEPEAHLHPQLQIKFIKYIQSVSQDLPNAQIIITTHSPVLASSVDLDKLIHLKDNNGAITASAMSRKHFGDSEDEATRKYINRWMDVTKSTMLFSRGVILVEGIAEALILPKLAELVLSEYNDTAIESGKKVLGASLEDMGISVININGINFKAFMKLFGNFDGASGPCIPVRCAGLTDKDPSNDIFPAKGDTVESANPVRLFIGDINSKPNTHMFMSPLKTFEYDLAMENPCILANALESVWQSENGSVRTELNNIVYRHSKAVCEKTLKADVEFIYRHLNSSFVGKGMFASALSEKINENFVVPQYVKDAVLWVCGADAND